MSRLTANELQRHLFHVSHKLCVSLQKITNNDKKDRLVVFHCLFSYKFIQRAFHHSCCLFYILPDLLVFTVCFIACTVLYIGVLIMIIGLRVNHHLNFSAYQLQHCMSYATQYQNKTQCFLTFLPCRDIANLEAHICLYLTFRAACILRRCRSNNRARCGCCQCVMMACH